MASTTMNYDAQFDSVNYQGLRTLGHGATISQFKDTVKLVNDEECQIKILRAGTTTEENNPRDLFYKMGENTVFFSFTIRVYQAMVNKTGGTIKEISGDVRSDTYWAWDDPPRNP